MDYKSKLEINISDLVQYLLRKWKSIIVCLLTFAIIGGGVSLYATPTEIEQNDDEADAKDIILDTPEERAQQADKLTEIQKEEVYRALQTYYDYKSTYDSLQEYYNNSILMRIDATKEPTYTITYSIDFNNGVGEALSTDVGVVDNIITIYRDAIFDQPVFNGIREVTGWSFDDSYIKEIYYLGRVSNNLMTLYINSMTQEQCEKIAEIIDQRILSTSEEAKKSYPHSIKKTGQNYYETNNNNRSEKQKAKRDAILSAENSMLNVKNNLVSKQKVYYTSLLEIAEKYIDEAGIINIDNLIESEVYHEKIDTMVEIEHKINIYSIFIGALVGVLIAVVLYTIGYVFSDKFRSDSDFAAFDVYLLGSFNQPISYKGVSGKFNKAIDELFKKKSDMNAFDNLLKRVSIIIGSDAERNDLKNVFVTGVSTDSDVENYRQKISETISVSNEARTISTAYGGSPLADYKSLEKLASCDAVVFVEKIGNTRYKDFDKLNDMCHRFGTKALGVVSIH